MRRTTLLDPSLITFLNVTMEEPKNDSEFIIQEIANVRFFRDFVFPNPQYHKGKWKRELADLIVAIGSKLMIVQLKTHFAKPGCPHDKDRAARKLEKAYGQFRTLIEAIRGGTLKYLRNAHGIEIPFDFFSFEEIHLVVLLHYVQDDESARMRILQKEFDDHGLSVTFNVFEVKDFFFLTHQFDTFKDFTAFLYVLNVIGRAMPELLSENLAVLVAHFKLYPAEIVELMDSGIRPAHLSAGVVDEFVAKGDDDERASQFFDRILRSLHSSVGRCVETISETLSGKFRDGVNSVETYWRGISALADTTRMEREQIGRLLLEKIAAAEIHDFAFGAAMLEDERRGLLVYASKTSYIDRARELGGLAIALIATYEIDSVTALGMPVHGVDEGCIVVSVLREWIPDVERLKQELSDNPLFSKRHTAA